jgi:hypothetical protein
MMEYYMFFYILTSPSSAAIATASAALLCPLGQLLLPLGRCWQLLARLPLR